MNCQTTWMSRLSKWRSSVLSPPFFTIARNRELLNPNPHFDRQGFCSSRPRNPSENLREERKVGAFEGEEVGVTVRKAFGGLGLWKIGVGDIGIVEFLKRKTSSRALLVSREIGYTANSRVLVFFSSLARFFPGNFFAKVLDRLYVFFTAFSRIKQKICQEARVAIGVWSQIAI